MFVSLIGLAYYLHAGKAYLEGYPPALNTVIILTLVIIAVFSLGCFLHMVLIGDPSRSELRKELTEYAEELHRLCRETNRRVSDVESAISRNVYALSARGLDCLGAARRINIAIAKRSREIDSLLASGDAYDLMDAHALTIKKLIIAENSIEAVMDAAPVPPLAPHEWSPTLDRLLHEVDVEIRLQAA